MSDLHICKKREFDVQKVVNALKDDIATFIKDKGKVNFVCFTGDLIAQGQHAWQGENQLEMAMDSFITPILKITDLDASHFLIVPGNHDVDTTAIDAVIEAGLLTKLKSKDAINTFIDSELKDTHNARILPFYKFLQDFQSEAVWKHPKGLGAAFIKQVSDTSIGFACLDSAWRAAGKGAEDKRKLVIGQRQVERAYASISSCNIKIALMHHPLDWLIDEDQDSVEVALRKFDIVLSGHLHNSWDKQVIGPKQSTLFSSGGSIFQGRSYFNGYSLLSINPFIKEVNVYFREYYDERDSFDEALRICSNGHYNWQLNCSNPAMQNAYKVAKPLKDGFTEKINKDLLTHIIDKSAPQKFEELFVSQPLSKQSEYQKEEEDQQEHVDIDDLIRGNENLVLLGKKELGKSTILNYITLKYLSEFGERKKIPFIIDLKKRLQGIEPIEKSMQSFVSKHTLPEEYLTVEQIKQLLNAGQCVVQFDNYDYYQPKQHEYLRAFTLTYPTNRFIFTMNEDIFHTVKADELHDFGCAYEKIYMHTFSRHAIRKIASKWFDGRTVDLDQLLDRVMLYLRCVGMPRTPFNVSLILAICSNYQEDFIPVNEASVMERFMEIILEKLSPNDTYRSTYDFSFKEDFLAYIAWKIVSAPNSQITKEDFLKLATQYFDDMDLSLVESKFGKLFFDKQILTENEGMVYFRYHCLFEYYLAKRAIVDNEALEWMLRDENYLQCSNELCFIAGIQRNRKDILTRIEGKLEPFVEKYLHLLANLESFSLRLEMEADAEGLKQELRENKLSEEEHDSLVDVPDNGREAVRPKVIKAETSPFEGRVFFKTLHLYGRIIKNNERADKNTKLNSLKKCIQGYRVFLATMIEMINHHHSRGANTEVRDERNEDIEFLYDLLSITAPIVVQNIAAESIGTAKLAKTVKQVMDAEANEFSKFMYVFLYADLKMPNFLQELAKFAEEVKNRDLLKLVLFKLMFYYHTRYVRGSNETTLENIIGDCVLALQRLPKNKKTDVLAELRKKDVRVPKLLQEVGSLD
nr:metallophosphoesterase [Sporomusa sphaeroides]